MANNFIIRPKITLGLKIFKTGIQLLKVFKIQNHRCHHTSIENQFIIKFSNYILLPLDALFFDSSISNFCSLTSKSNQLNFNLDFITFGQTYKSNDIINPALDINNIVPRGIEWFKTLIKEYPKILLSFLSTIKLFYSKLEINIKIGIIWKKKTLSSHPNSSQQHPFNWYFCTNGLG